MEKHLSPALTKLVDWSVSELGKVIQSQLGIVAFRRIEKIRRFVKRPSRNKFKDLLKLKKDLESLSPEEQYQVAHAFALMLELINSCEAAYRTYRLRIENNERDIGKGSIHTYGRIIHVLTAHPTESRSPEIIFYFKKIQTLLQHRLESPGFEDLEQLRSLITLAWQIPMSKQRRPTVMDEAAYVYSLALNKDLIDLYLKQRIKKQPFYLRTWVGGDKDGHPGVDEKTMLGSLQMARGHIADWIFETFAEFEADLSPLTQAVSFKKNEILKLQQSVRNFKQQLRGIRKIRTGDALRVQSLRAHLDSLITLYWQFFKTESEILRKILYIFKIFPGLVVPLEIREQSALVHEAVNNPQKNLNITRMLKTLAKISPEHDPKFYVRGFILSQTESAKDIEAGLNLSVRHLGEPRLPILPLFESSHALENSADIVTAYLENPRRRKIVKKYWSGQFEVMVGYSDSSKENGSFPSKYLIRKALFQLEKIIKRFDLYPVFFHGSGGSVERGGGSIQEQIEWWPLSALENVKVTIQGEMIYRNYSSPEILERQLERFAESRDMQSRLKINKLAAPLEKSLKKFSEAVQARYQETVKDPQFLKMVELATPYSYLNDLKMGSRPAKRRESVNLSGLRAIPWVLCWTQTRTLFPTWWGAGSYWQNLSQADKNYLRRALGKSTLFSTYMKLLGFTLQKIDLDIFHLYLAASALSDVEKKEFSQMFLKELDACKDFFKDVMGTNDFLWYRPWLKTSIELRSPLINPLNVLQLIALKEHNLLLLRETVTGVASGMLTTG
ncbi:MAG: phosphoenolpyruvate carboxylase [Bacillota bacterium]